MPDAWDLLPETERKADTVETFIIFCEGEVTEPVYFEGFQIPGKLKVNSVTDQKQGSRHISNAVEYCKKLDLIESTNGVFQVKQNVTEHLWCAYDRDLENEDLNLVNVADDNDFSDSIDTAQRKGLKVAWSNDVFELWVLLHFEDVPVGQRLHRRYIYDRLTEVFKALPGKSAAFEAITTNPKFECEQVMKRRRHFIMHVKPLLKPRLAAATIRAKSLELIYNVDIPFHDRNPCTMVHHLVESLISFQ